MTYVITFEGGEGAGKGTQIELLKNHLQLKGLTVNCVYEPGHTFVGELCRALVKGKFDTLKQSELLGEKLSAESYKNLEKLIATHKSRDPLTQTQLFLSARSSVFEELTHTTADVSIIDRSIDSTIVYQGYAQDPTLIPYIKKANDIIQQRTVSVESTIYLDIPVHIGLQRAIKRKGETVQADWFEAQKIDFHEKVRNGYLQLAIENPFRIIQIEGMTQEYTQKNPQQIHQEICEKLHKVITNIAYNRCK
jgi:dTMP kinase